MELGKEKQGGRGIRGSKEYGEVGTTLTALHEGKREGEVFKFKACELKRTEVEETRRCPINGLEQGEGQHGT